MPELCEGPQRPARYKSKESKTALRPRKSEETKVAYFTGGLHTSAEKLGPAPSGGWEAAWADPREEIIAEGPFVLRFRLQRKAVPDQVLRDGETRSVLALLGTPLPGQEGRLLLPDFLADPPGAAGSLEGHFALIAYDGRTGRLILGSDVNAFVPIFYTVSGGSFLFSSSELALAASIGARADDLGFAQAILLGAPWAGRTRFSEIKRLGPGELLVVHPDGTLTKERYFKPENQPSWAGDFEAVLNRFTETLRCTVDLFWRAALRHDRVWADLTAGEDARLVVAVCRDRKLPFCARVGGFPGSRDQEVAQEAARRAGFPIVLEPYVIPDCADVPESLDPIVLSCDGYRSFFYACVRYATAAKYPLHCFDHLHFAGMPGGEAFRGTYYRRAGVISPSRARRFDWRFFVRLKYLLDFVPGLTAVSDDQFLDAVYAAVEEALAEANQLHAGLQVDHLLREFQTACWGMNRRTPFYLPLGTAALTRALYAVPPQFKFRGRLTRAATEILFPELAWVKTERGVPTVRMTPTRFYLFIPEYLAGAEKVISGVIKRLLHFAQRSPTLSGFHRPDLYQALIAHIFHEEPYRSWFSEPQAMVTGEMYRSDALSAFLRQAREGKCRYVEILGRIVNAELAFRWVNKHSKSQAPAPQRTGGNT